MSALSRLLYASAAQAARGLAHVAPVSDHKLWRALRGRRGVRERFEHWGREYRDTDRPLLWMHAPSVGEGLQAKPVAHLLRERHPELQLAYTYFSPSATAFARSLDTDFADFLPFDTRGDALAALQALKPSALVFSKLDVWPVLTETAHARDVPLGLISATLAERSSRRAPLLGALLRGAYQRLDAVGAISAEDADRLVALGVRREVVRVTGDTRYDQVWARAMQADQHRALLDPLRSDRVTLVAGSTWPADERVLLPAWERLCAEVPQARLIIAPHEPVKEHLVPIERWASAAGLRHERLSRSSGNDTDVLLVDRVGVLGELYALASAAFVGGGFHAAGLHSVLEPAAYGAPVLFGPRFHASREAGLLRDNEGGVPVTDATALASALRNWFLDAAAREAAGARARQLVEQGLGAAERSYALVRELLEVGSSAPIPPP